MSPDEQQLRVAHRAGSPGANNGHQEHFQGDQRATHSLQTQRTRAHEVERLRSLQTLRGQPAQTKLSHRKYL